MYAGTGNYANQNNMSNNSYNNKGKGYQPGGYQGCGKGYDAGGKGQWQGRDTYDIKGKQGGKDYKGKGAGKGKGDSKCFLCGGFGHIARNCATRPPMRLNELDEGFEDYCEQAARESAKEEEAGSITEGVWSFQSEEDCKGWQKILKRRTKDIAAVGMDDYKRGTEVETKNKFSALEENEEECEDECDMGAILEKKGDLVKVEILVDSGAGDSVMPVGLFPELAVKANNQSKAGKCFFNASGNPVPNQGEKVVKFYTPAGNVQHIKWQVAKVIKPLLAVGKLEDAGCSVVVGKGGRYILNPTTNEKIPMIKSNGTYKVHLWVNTKETGPVFSRQGP